MIGELLSIIVPVYNVEQYVSECLDSILCQTYKNIELILIDDGSDDTSGEICDRYALQDPRVQVIHKNNAGVSEARNDGLKSAHGRYITFVDPDDVVLSDIYIRMIQVIEEDRVDACCCSYYDLIGNKKVTSRPMLYQCKGTDAVKIMLRERYYTTVVWNKVFRREKLMRAGHFIMFDCNYTVGEDEKWLFDVFRDADITMKFIGSPLYCWRKRENSAINQNNQGITRQKLDGIKIQENLLIKAQNIGDEELEKLLKKKLYGAIYIIAQNCYMRNDDSNFTIYYAKIRDWNNLKGNRVLRKLKNLIWKIMMEIRYRKLLGKK